MSCNRRGAIIQKGGLEDKDLFPFYDKSGSKASLRYAPTDVIADHIAQNLPPFEDPSDRGDYSSTLKPLRNTADYFVFNRNEVNPSKWSIDPEKISELPYYAKPKQYENPDDDPNLINLSDFVTETEMYDHTSYPWIPTATSKVSATPGSVYKSGTGKDAVYVYTDKDGVEMGAEPDLSPNSPFKKLPAHYVEQVVNIGNYCTEATYTSSIAKDAIQLAKNSKQTLFYPAGVWAHDEEIPLTGVNVEFHPQAVVINPNGFPFIVEGNGWGFTNQQRTQLPDGITLAETRSGRAKFVTFATPRSDIKPEDGCTFRADNYWNAEINGNASGGACMRTYFEYGRQETASGSGGHLVADWQVYNFNGKTPSGSTTEFTPLSIGVVVREQDLDAGPSGETNLTNNGAPNVYNELSVISGSQVAEDYLSGLCVLTNKFTQGTFIGGDKKGSDGLSVVTTPTSGAFNNQVSKSKDSSAGTFPLRNGIQIAGFAGPLGVGYTNGGHEAHARSAFDTALKLGGLGCGVWNPNPTTARSKYQNGIDIQDFTNIAISISNQHPNKTDVLTPAIQVTQGAGTLVHGDPIRPPASLATTVGMPAYLYSDIYSQNAQNNTSDANYKTGVRPYSDAELAAGYDLQHIAYKFIEADEREKQGGKSAREHCGVIAQEVIDVFKSHGVDAMGLGFICFDKWDDHYEVEPAVIEWKMTGLDENQQEVWDEVEVAPETKYLHTPAGERYSIRYTELHSLVLAALKNKIQSIEDRLNRAGI